MQGNMSTSKRLTYKSLNKLAANDLAELLIETRAPDLSRMIIDLTLRAISKRLVLKSDPRSNKPLKTSFGLGSTTVLKIEVETGVRKNYPCLYPWKSFIKTRTPSKMLNAMGNYDVEHMPEDLRNFISKWMTDWVVSCASQCGKATLILAQWLREVIPRNMTKLSRVVELVKLAKTNAMKMEGKEESQDTSTFVPIAESPGGKALKECLTTDGKWMMTSFARMVVEEKDEEATSLWKLFLDTARDDVFHFERDRALPALLQSTIVALSKSHRTAYRTALRSVATDDSYDVFVRRAHDLMLERQEEAERSSQRTSNVLELYRDAASIQVEFQDYVELLAKKLSQFSVEAIVPNKLKGLYRVLEKTAYNNFDAKGVFDVVRGALGFNSMSGMVLALEFLASDKNIEIVRIKDRFGKPTSGGWSDCLINAVFVSDPSKHVFEVQLLHQKMMFVRKTCGAHHTYNAFRTAIELLEAKGLDLPSMLEEDFFKELPERGRGGENDKNNGSAANVDALVNALEIVLDRKLAGMEERIGQRLDRMETRLQNIESNVVSESVAHERKKNSVRESSKQVALELE